MSFIEGRMIKSPHLSVEKMETSALLKKKVKESNNRKYATKEFQIWESKSTVAKNIFDPYGFAKKLKLCFFDIPNINDQSPESDHFFNVLAECDNLALFNLTVIQIIIMKAWDEIFKFFIFFFLLPYLTLIAAFTYWAVHLDKMDPSSEDCES